MELWLLLEEGLERTETETEETGRASEREREREGWWWWSAVFFFSWQPFPPSFPLLLFLSSPPFIVIFVALRYASLFAPSPILQGFKPLFALPLLLLSMISAPGITHLSIPPRSAIFFSIPLSSFNFFFFYCFVISIRLYWSCGKKKRERKRKQSLTELELVLIVPNIYMLVCSKTREFTIDGGKKNWVWSFK